MTTILISNNAPALQACEPHVTVEAEYGEAVVSGSLLTMAHHGPRAGQKAPCAYGNDCVQKTPGLVVGVSHVDLDTIGGIMAALGSKLDVPSFWRLAEQVDLGGAHKLATFGANVEDLGRLYAYWAFSQSVRVYAPRDGSVADVTSDVFQHVEALTAILSGARALLDAGEAFRDDESALNRETFQSIEGGVILRSSIRFVNHLYVAPDGQVGRAVVTHNSGNDLSGGAITLSLADPIEGVSCGAILRDLFGPEAGGHAGIGGSPRGKPLPYSEAVRTADAIRALL